MYFIFFEQIGCKTCYMIVSWYVLKICSIWLIWYIFYLVVGADLYLYDAQKFLLVQTMLKFKRWMQNVKIYLLEQDELFDGILGVEFEKISTSL